jgi:hypothetical protein
MGGFCWARFFSCLMDGRPACGDRTLGLMLMLAIILFDEAVAALRRLDCYLAPKRPLSIWSYFLIQVKTPLFSAD